MKSCIYKGGGVMSVISALHLVSDAKSEDVRPRAVFKRVGRLAH